MKNSPDLTPPEEREHIQLWNDDNWWIIRHVPTGVTTQGETRLRALLMLADALNGYHDEEKEDLLAGAEDVFVSDDDFVEDIEFKTESDP